MLGSLFKMQSSLVVTNGNLGHGDLDRSQTERPVITWWSDAEEHDVADEVAEYQRQTTDQPLSTCEVTTTRPTEHREPDVFVIDAAAQQSTQSVDIIDVKSVLKIFKKR